MRQRHAGASSITLSTRCNDPRHVHPSQKHAETNSLIETIRSLSRRNPCQTMLKGRATGGPDTKSDPYVQDSPPPRISDLDKTTISTARGTCQVLSYQVLSQVSRSGPAMRSVAGMEARAPSARKAACAARMRTRDPLILRAALRPSETSRSLLTLGSMTSADPGPAPSVAAPRGRRSPRTTRRSREPTCVSCSPRTRRAGSG